MRPLAWLVSVAVISATAHAEPLYCSMWQGIRTCRSPSGYTSHETEWHPIRPLRPYLLARRSASPQPSSFGSDQ